MHSHTSLSAIIVAHDSDHVIAHPLDSLRKAGIPAENIWVVDSGSPSTTFLQTLQEKWYFHLRLEKQNVGFARANNIALAEIVQTRPDIACCILVNPDLVVPPQWSTCLVSHLADHRYRECGILSGPLYGIDLAKGTSTGLIDSLGIEQTFWGRWHDVCQGQAISALPKLPAVWHPTAICGALMAIRRPALEQITSHRGMFFDESLVMYKEDIEVSLFAKRLGWQLAMFDDLAAYHQRGWNTDRTMISYWRRAVSARNDVIVALRYRPHTLPYALAKWTYVHWLEKN